MDEALKARRLGSATARRLRIQERQIQQHAAHQERLDRKREVMLDIRSLEATDEDSDVSLPSTPGLDSDASTPSSQSSARTPEETTSAYTLGRLPSELQYMVVNTKMSTDALKESRLMIPKQQSPLKMQATLTTIADWNYDRFSVALDPFEVEEMLRANVDTEDSEPSTSDDDFEECSPIEIATPILYTVPTMRPSVISITSPRCPPQSPVVEASAIRHDQANPRNLVSQQHTSKSSQEGFRAGEAMLFRLSNSSQETMASVFSSSQVSRSVSLTSYSNTSISRSVSETSYRDPGIKSPKRKSSLPSLFGSNKAGAPKIGSLKKLMRSSTMGPPSSAHQSHTSLHRQPSMATLETHFESRNSSMDMSSPAVRDLRSISLATELSPRLLPESTTGQPRSQSESSQLEPETQQKPSVDGVLTSTKPISKFRSRSGSIGLTLKSLATGPKKADATAPPMPNLSVSLPSPNIKLQTLTLPSPLSPRFPRLSPTTYSPNPSRNSPTAPGASFGLGLRY